MKLISQYLKPKLSAYSKVIENYFFMTFLQGSNMLIGLLIYPYLIRVLGQEIYGTYIFIFSNVQFFILFISFGFSFPALKTISLHPDDSGVKSRTVSEVFTAKSYLFVLCAIVLGILICFVPFVRTHALLYLLIFATAIQDILFPKWFFQGIQKMKFVTFVNLTIRLLTIPFIFIFVKSPNDLLEYTVIVSVFPVLGGIFTAIYLKIKEDIRIHFVSLRSLKSVFRDALPFFWTTALGTIKQEAVTFIIGITFSMKEVALYDLANKIIVIPRLITSSINTAIFPSIIKNLYPEKIRKIIRYEHLMGLSIVALIVIFGYWAVLLLGGREMLLSYPLAIILSITIYTWLVVGCYINFLFVPQNRYYFVTKNQFAALIAFILFALGGLFMYKSIVIIVVAYVLSHFVEIFYCKFLIKKHRLL